MIVGTPAVAQTQPAQTPPQATEVEEIIVTGSRIPRLNLEQPTPVSTVSREAIENAGTQNLGEILAELPGMSRADTVRGNADLGGGEFSGLSFANLRALGASRTLTLIDGKRHVGAYTGTTAVDLNSIPTALVDRIETSTGGASAVYGSDAVSGVVNVILRKNFEGVEVGAQYGSSRGGVGVSWDFDATIGGNFAEGRGNATFSFLTSHEDEVRSADVPYLGLNLGTIANPLNTGPNDGIPDRLWVQNVGSDWIDERGVLFDDYTGAVFGFDRNGNVVAQPPRTASNSAAFGSFASYCDTCFYTDEWLVLIPESDRVGFNTTVRYDLTPGVRFYADAKHIRAKYHDVFQPDFRFFEDLIAPDNAFVTPQIVSAVGFALANDGLYLNRFLGDVRGGNGRDSDTERTTSRIVAGLEGDFDAGFAEMNWDLSVNYGRVENSAVAYGNLIGGNYAAAIDVVRDGNGDIVCRSTLDPTTAPTGTVPGQTCVPYNPFIAQNSPEALDYVTAESFTDDELTQRVIQGTVSFDTSRFLNLPGGPIGIAGGFEQREERSIRMVDEFTRTGLTTTAPTPNSDGGFDVVEGFIEFAMPILRDAPFANVLSVDGAYRVADYSHTGRAEAWKLGFLYAPVEDVTFRGTVGQAVRAPNITEAFQPTSPGFANIFDPCDPTRINADPDRAANCALDTRLPSVPFPSSTNASIDTLTGGNPNLDPETSESFTLGVIVQPRWLPGLAVTLDYYDIRIEDAIAQTASQTLINNCYDSPGGLSQEYCSLFDRETDPTDVFFGNIILLRNQYLNISSLETSGWDMNVNYSTDVGAWTERFPSMAWANGRLSASLKATYVESLDRFEFQDRPDVVNNNAGQIGDPEWRYLGRVTYDQGPLAVTWEVRYEGEVTNGEVTPATGVNRAEGTDFPFLDSQTYHDLIVRYSLENWIGSRNVEVFAGVNNVFDETLPYTTAITDAQYDYMGRRFFAGMRARF